MDVLLQVPRPTRFGSGLCWIDANGVAQIGLLLRPCGWRIYAGGFVCHSAAAKELFDARNGHAHRTSAAGVTYAVRLVE